MESFDILGPDESLDITPYVIGSDGQITIEVNCIGEVTLTTPSINSSGLLTTGVIPSTNVAPSGSGLFMGADYLGYYADAAWKTYMDNSGGFYLGGESGALTWDGSTLKVTGEINVTSGTATKVFYQDAEPGSGMKDGDLWIDTDGGDTLYTYQTDTWVSVQSSGNGVQFFQQSAIPTSLAEGDLWQDTDDNLIYRAAAIGADEITAGEWELFALEASNVGTTIISGGKIVTGLLTATNIQTGTLDCSLLTVSNLNAGSITAGSISVTYTDAKCANANADQTSVNTAANAASYTGAAIATTYTAAKCTDANADQTSANTAAAISGQGNLATLNTVDTAQINNLAVNVDKIANTTITAGKIATGTITATQIAANTITAAKIAVGTITATELATNSITAVKITAGTITADKIISTAGISDQRLALGDYGSDTVGSGGFTTITHNAGRLGVPTVRCGESACQYNYSLTYTTYGNTTSSFKAAGSTGSYTAQWEYF